MLSEFVQKISELVTESSGLQISWNQDLDTYFLRHPDGSVHEHRPAPRLRSAGICSLDGLVTAVKDGNICPLPEVYHATNGISVFCDRSNRREALYCPLEKSDKFAYLMNMARKPICMPPKDMIKELRYRLGDREPNGIEAVIAGLRRIDFTRRSDGHSHVDHGRESLGKSVEMQVQQSDKIPERFVLSVPVYSTLGFSNHSKVQVDMGLHLNMEEGTVFLAPIADEIRFAINFAHTHIHDALIAALGNDIPVIHGYANLDLSAGLHQQIDPLGYTEGQIATIKEGCKTL